MSYDSSRDWPEDYFHENGRYENTCHFCKKLFQGNKYRLTCKSCFQAIRNNKQPPVVSNAKFESVSAPITISKAPEPVGYWVLYPGSSLACNFAMYKKPTDEQIKNTEQLLGWGWIDA